MKLNMLVQSLIVSYFTVLSTIGLLAAVPIVYSVDHSFGKSEPGTPDGLTLGIDGNFYATSKNGGMDGNSGTIFKVTSGGQLTPLYDFTNSSAGLQPPASLVSDGAGNFYGVTQFSVGTNGTIFKFTSSGAVTVLHSFGDGSVPNDGGNPTASLVFGSDGYLYGTTPVGSIGSGCLYKVSTQGAYKVLHVFGDGSVPNDGANPEAELTLNSDGSLYGTTVAGGAARLGTVFKVTPAGVVTILHSFGDGTVPNDGSGPVSALVKGTDGNFYGVTHDGGAAGVGVVFKITPQGGLTILHSFGDGSVVNDGANPSAKLIQGANGNFYGSTVAGGISGGGTYFEITPAGVETILHQCSSDAYNPNSALIKGQDGNFYGVTAYGQPSGSGCVIRLSPSGSFSVILSIPAPDASDPEAALTLGPQGNLFGTTFAGGSSSAGTIFELSQSYKETILDNFSFPNDIQPVSPLVYNSDGNFYGTVSSVDSGGETSNEGQVVKVTPQGILTVLHEFGDSSGTDGLIPEAGLVKGPDGNFYGMTVSSEATGGGTIFRISTAGSYQSIHQFGDGTVANDGASPDHSLILGSDGNFYGTTPSGGSQNLGVIFRVNTQGTVTILHNFGDGSIADDGTVPEASLVQDSTGNFYGTTNQGGLNNLGVVFELTKQGNYSILHQFVGGTLDGANPRASLLLALDGNLYGTTTNGGSAGGGTIFEISPAGTFSLLHSFGSLPGDGLNPDAPLIETSPGLFYGTTAGGGSYGGAYSGGTAYSFVVPIVYEAENSTPVASIPNSLSINRSSSYSNGAAIQFTGTAAGQYVEFTLKNVPKGTYSLNLTYKAFSTRGIVQASVNGVKIGAPLDEYNGNSIYGLVDDLGTITVPSNENLVFRLTLTGKNAKSSGYTVMTDKISLNSLN